MRWVDYNYRAEITARQQNKNNLYLRRTPPSGNQPCTKPNPLQEHHDNAITTTSHMTKCVVAVPSKKNNINIFRKQPTLLSGELSYKTTKKNITDILISLTTKFTYDWKLQPKEICSVKIHMHSSYMRYINKTREICVSLMSKPIIPFKPIFCCRCCLPLSGRRSCLDFCRTHARMANNIYNRTDDAYTHTRKPANQIRDSFGMVDSFSFVFNILFRNLFTPLFAVRFFCWNMNTIYAFVVFFYLILFCSTVPLSVYYIFLFFLHFSSSICATAICNCYLIVWLVWLVILR